LDITMELRPDIAALLADADGPEPYTLALIGQLRPITEMLTDSCPGWSAEDIGTLGWIAMELVSNAIAAAMGSALGHATGIPRRDLLEVLGTSAVWPGPEHLRRPAGSPEAGIAFRLAVGMEPEDWLGMPLAERFQSIGIRAESGWVTVSYSVSPESGELDLLVSSLTPPLEGDLVEIRGRLSDPDACRARISGIRELHRDPEGMLHMPSFTGGGGMGLILCGEKARGLGLTLDLASSIGDDIQVTLRLHGTVRRPEPAEGGGK
jgi:hypothetical protein